MWSEWDGSSVIHQLSHVPALFLTEGVALFCVTESNHQPHRLVKSAGCPKLGVVQPADDTGGKPLSGGLGGEIGGGNADVDGAVVYLRDSGAKRGGFIVEERSEITISTGA